MFQKAIESSTERDFFLVPAKEFRAFLAGPLPVHSSRSLQTQKGTQKQLRNAHLAPQHEKEIQMDSHLNR